MKKYKNPEPFRAGIPRMNGTDLVCEAISMSFGTYQAFLDDNVGKNKVEMLSLLFKVEIENLKDVNTKVLNEVWTDYLDYMKGKTG